MPSFASKSTSQEMFAAAILLAAAATSHAQCTSEWTAVQTGNFGGGMNVRAAIEWDDGTGPALYLGGDFSIMGGTFTPGIVKWDGERFTSLNCGFLYNSGGQYGTVTGLAVMDPDGSGPLHDVLVASGDFVMANGANFSDVGNVATWDGLSWTPLGDTSTFRTPNPQSGGVNARVADIAVFDDGTGPHLYACGDFQLPDNNRALARWNGISWESVGLTFQTQGSMERLHVHNDGSGNKLYIVGTNMDFFPGSVPAQFLIRWNGAAFEQVGSGPGNPATVGNPRFIGDLATFDPDGAGPSPALLCAAGRYGSLSNSQLDLFTWNGTAWTQRTVPSSEPGEASNNYRGLTTLAVFNDGSGPALFMGPQQVNDGAHPSTAHFYRAKKWNGTTFSNVAESVRPNTPINESTVPACMVPYTLGTTPKLCIGYYAQGDQIVQQYDGVRWATMPGQTGPSGTFRVSAATMWDSDGAGPNPALLYCVGEFPWGNAATYNGISFAALPPFPASAQPVLSCTACTVFNDGTGEALYIGTTKGSSAEGIPDSLGSGVYKLVGSSWVPVGVENSFRAVNPNNTDVFNDSIQSLCAFNDGSGSRLFATGRFETINGVNVNHIARWSGTAWEPFGPAGSIGMQSTLADASLGFYQPTGKQLLTFNDGTGDALYTVGLFTRIAGIRAAGIARWNGSAWSAYGTDFSEQVRLAYQITAAVHDDGTGPRLFASGMAIGGSLNINEPHVHAWNGTAWEDRSGGFPWTLQNTSLMGSLDNGTGRKLLLSGMDMDTGVAGIFEFNGSFWSEVPNSLCWGTGDGRVPAFEYNSARHGLLLETGPGMNGTLQPCQYFGVDMAPSVTMAVWACESVTPACPGDFNNSGSVTADDIFAFLDAWFAQNGQTGPSLSADTNADNAVTADDIFAYLDLWFANNGNTCP